MKDWSKAYEKTEKGFLMRAYRNLVSRCTGVQKKKFHLYQDMQYLSKDEFYSWSENDPTFRKLFKEWEDSNYDRKLSPSVDRIWPMFGYIKDNMRWMTHSENSSRAIKGFSTKSENIFWTSDLHIGHKNILKYNRQEFSTVEEMHEHIIEEWNKVVKPQDLVFNLGDVCLGNLENAADVLGSLNGFIYTITANHDSEKSFNVFNTISDKQIYSDEFLKEVKVDGVGVTMCHFPLVCWNKSEYGSIHVFGHAHGSIEGVGKSMDVGLDSAKKLIGEYRPFTHKEVCDILSKKEVFDARHGVSLKDR
jgi:calcineurin-like phosphoesterase family protein